MSYTPSIIVKKDDFYKHCQIFENHFLEPDEEEGKVLEFLHQVFRNHDVFKIDDVEMILISCDELTYFNKLVREKLDELEIQYGLSN